MTYVVWYVETNAMPQCSLLQQSGGIQAERYKGTAHTSQAMPALLVVYRVLLGDIKCHHLTAVSERRRVNIERKLQFHPHSKADSLTISALTQNSSYKASKNRHFTPSKDR